MSGSLELEGGGGVAPEPATRWRIRAIEGNAWRNDNLDIDLVVASTSPVVVHAIERAAARNGVELERVDEEGRGQAGS